MDPEEFEDGFDDVEAAEEVGQDNGGEFEAEAEPTGPPEGFIQRDEYDAVLAELEEERSRGRAAQAFASDAQQRLSMEGAIRRELERMYHDHATQQERHAQMQPPAAEGVEEWLVEPQQIASYVGRYGEWVRTQTLQQLQPFLSRFALYDSLLPAVLTREAESSMTRAKEMLEREGVQDFDELRPEIEQAFASNPAGARLLLDPATVAAVYQFIARQKGGVRPVREKAQPIPSVGVSRGGGGRRTAAAPVTLAVKSIAERLQISPAKLAERIAKRRAAN